MNNDVIYDKARVEGELRSRGLWHSFIQGNGVIIDRHNDGMDIFARYHTGKDICYVWITDIPEEAREDALSILKGEWRGNI